MPRIVILLLILVVGGAALAPMIMMLGLDPVPGDFHLTFGNTRVNVPVAYSLCASLVMALFLMVMKR